MTDPHAVASDAVVYVVGEGGEAPVKIGFTSDPKRRLAALQCGSPVKLKVLATFKGGQDLERALHRYLDEHRLAGEWFAIPGPNPVEVVATAVEQVEACATVPSQRRSQVASRCAISVCSCGHRAQNHGYRSLTLNGQLITCGTDLPYDESNQEWPCRCTGYDGESGVEAVPERSFDDFPPSIYSVSEKTAPGTWSPERPLYQSPWI